MPAPAEIPDNTITLALAGDVMLGRMVNEAILKKGPAYPWGDVLPLVREADLALINLECVIAASGEPFQPPRVFSFRAAPEAVEVLTLAGVDHVTLSNNHAMDFQAAALLETIEHLDAAGIAHAGAGAHATAASAHALLEAGGIRVGVVAFADHFEEYAASQSEPGTNVIPISLEDLHFDRVRTSIDEARQEADLVVFSIHWGPNMRHVPTSGFRDFARAVMDAGADVFHGHSAHIFQGIEIHNGKPIFYDTGDLIDDYYVDEEHKNDQQLLFLVHADRDSVVGIELVPLVISRMQVNLATGAALEEISDRIITLSTPMGTHIERRGERLVVLLADR